MVKLDQLGTEKRNEKTMHLDELSIHELLTIMNEEDLNVVNAVKEALNDIEKAASAVIDTLNQKGRLIYVGAGTSGRLGVLDAVECVPTFSTTDEVIAIMAGGNEAFVRAKEGAEDSKILAQDDLKAHDLSERDLVVAIAASGRTPYCIGALEYARSIKAKTVSISCNKNALLSEYADIAIEVDAGPEILTGSTRLKAGTCQKMILNMISTASMVGIGKVYGNLMVDMKATNEKLVERARRIVMQATCCDYQKATETLNLCDYHIKEAILMILLNINQKEAQERLQDTKGFVGKALKEENI